MQDRSEMSAELAAYMASNGRQGGHARAKLSHTARGRRRLRAIGKAGAKARWKRWRQQQRAAEGENAPAAAA